MSDTSCKSVRLLPCGRSFPSVIPVFFRNLTGIYAFCHGFGLIIVFPVFKSKLLSYSTRGSEYCVLQSGVLYCQASSVSE